MAAPGIYRELVEYLAEHATPEIILAFRISDTAQQRADELTERNKAGQLTRDEAQELAGLIEFDELLSLLKAKALRHQHQPQHT